MGSMRVARHAGTELAVTVTTKTSSIKAAKVNGSVAVTPTNIPDKSRVNTHAAMPAIIPIIVIRKL